MDNSLRALLAAAARELRVPLTEDQLSLFGVHYRELVFWNRNVNLIAPASPRDIIVRHFVDSLTAVPFISRRDGRLIDLGSGGGFPGIPLKIALPSLQVDLLEASRKKTSYLKHTLRRLQLPETRVLHARAEEVMQTGELRHSFDFVISRAAVPLPKLFEFAKYFLAPQGRLIAMKGPQSKEETGQAAAFYLAFEAAHPLTVPCGGGRRKILLYQRVI